MTTFLGGGGNCLPDIVISLRPISDGGCGGASRMTTGSGVFGLGGCCLMISGGAGGTNELASCVMKISPIFI